jgi:hypothetical protein
MIDQRLRALESQGKDAAPKPRSRRGNSSDIVPNSNLSIEITHIEYGHIILFIPIMDGVKLPVKIIQLGENSFVGPKGELYDKLPLPEQLRSIYWIK